MVIQAIETRYKGFRFRSRLEARWAVFFDAAGIQWEYEKEGYNLNGLLYLPDFWLPIQKQWVEVKGAPPPCPSIENERCKRLFEHTGFEVFMVFGDLCPCHCTADSVVHGSNRGWTRRAAEYGDWDDGCCEWGECPLCGMLGLAHCGQHEICNCICNGWFDRKPAQPGDHSRCSVCNASLSGGDPATQTGPHKPWMNSDSKRLMAAYEKARSARFEHGESP